MPFKLKHLRISNENWVKLIDWLFRVLYPTQEFFIYMETSPLPVKGCKMYAYAQRSWHLSREESLSCCDTGPRFFRSHPKDLPIQSPLTIHKEMWRINSNPDLFGIPSQKIQICAASWHTCSAQLFKEFTGVRLGQDAFGYCVIC
jgi:hypothetical protein